MTPTERRYLRYFLLAQIKRGESPYTNAGHPRLAVAEELESLRAAKLWDWKDPEFQVLRVLTPAGEAFLAEWLKETTR